MKKLVTIDILRSFAAISILLFHYTYRFQELTESSNLSWPVEVNFGYGAISTFFILSGFLTSYYFFSSNGDPKKYIINRFFRLYPTFWLCLIISCIVLYGTYYVILSSKTILFNFTMVPGLFHVPFIDGAYWTMQYEFIFTIIVTLALCLKFAKSRILILCIWTSVITVLNIFNIQNSALLFKFFAIITMPKYAPFFLSGIAIAELTNFNGGGKAIPACIFIMAFLSIICIYSLGPMTIYALVTALLLLFIPSLEPFISKNHNLNRLFNFIAVISFPLYLLHQYSGYNIMDKLIILGYRSELIIIAPTLIMFIGAAIIHKGLEVPMHKFENKILSNFRLK